MIGWLERGLILVFVIMSQYEAIGFLIAAKSILRFSEASKGDEKSEYVLTGTLLSLAIALCLGIIVLKCIYKIGIQASASQHLERRGFGVRPETPLELSAFSYEGFEFATQSGETAYSHFIRERQHTSLATAELPCFDLCRGEKNIIVAKNCMI